MVTARQLDLRVTLIDARGVVLADSSLDRAGVAAMDNHLGRPEIQQALADGNGESLRRSATTGVEFLYMARRVDGRAPTRFVRLAVPTASLADLPAGHVLSLLLVYPGTFLLLAALGYLLIRAPLRSLERMRAVARRVADGQTREALPYEGDDELGRLAAEVNRMKRKLEARIAGLQVERQRAASVTSQMREGLLVVDADRRVLFGNRAFGRIFHLDFDPKGHLLAEIIRAPTVIRDLEAHELAREVAAQVAHRHPESRVGISVDLPSPFPMRADRRRLEQVLLNLVDNAVKFSRPGGEVRIRGEANGSRVQLRVEDDGVGIPSDSLEKVFHRFYRVDKARSREVGGTGLGLAIVKHLMRLHGGSVRVRSELGHGSTFLLDFPRDAPPS